MSPIPQLELHDAHLLDVTVQANPAFEGTNDPKATVAFQHTSARHASDPSRIRVELRARISSEDNEPRRKPYWIEIAVAGYFKSREEKPGGEVPWLLVENALTILYGVARGIVTSVTGSGPYGKFLLPTITFARATEEPSQSPGTMQIADRPAKTKRSAGRKAGPKRGR